MAKVMVLGSGGREHTLCWWFQQYGHTVFAAPGNGGTDSLGVNIDLDINDFNTVASAARHHSIDLVVVGPEAPLCNGIVDYWHKKNLPDKGIHIFGPRARKGPRGGEGDGAAILEGSKIFAREFATRHGIPVPEYIPFKSCHYQTNHDQACTHWNHRSNTGKEKLMVVKADGLCGGKGVFVCDDDNQVFGAIRSMQQFKGAGDNFLLEKRLVGEEASITVVTDGKSYKMFHHSQDHKRRYDGDEGPNTGGMGAYAPTKLIDEGLEKKIAKEIIEPTIKGLKKENMQYAGVIYFAIMMHEDKPYLLEYNCRFGDPEAQVILPLVDSDPHGLMMACINGELDKADFKIRHSYACCVVLADKEYPTGSCAKGNEITFGPAMEGVEIFHAGTKMDSGKVVVNGGRVLGVTGISAVDHKNAITDLAYAAAESIHFDGKDCRTDIGYRVLER